MNLTGRSALVTGAGRGIGRAIAVALAKAGADVAINYAGNEAAAKETETLCAECGVKTLVIKADVSNAEDCRAMIDQVKDTFGKIDILVNNAGITKDKLMIGMSEADFMDVINTNLKGSFLCMQMVSKLMIKQRYGRIINLSSVVGLHGNAGQVNYAASKAGVIGMTKSAAKELASRNITVNAVAPGMIDTDMTAVISDKAKEAMLSSIPAGRAGKPEDVANVVAFLASEEAAYMTGQVVSVDGGMGV
ncbi:MAG: 3-oxoacyl-[acyl-carrier-protein] reductase [Lachnospiraceae bacterium]|nr:3-oxoacyl-[acyl-carrier-protein] reductase [Lachnospiraceae bacterium]